MKKKNILFMFIFLLISGCSSVKSGLIQAGENMQEIAIHNAIVDFSASCSLYKKDSVFSVSFKDTLYSMTLKKTDDRESWWERDKLYEDVATVTISASPEYKFLFTKSTIVGSKGKLPSRFLVKDHKLFYWFDDNYPLTQEMLDVLWKYNLLQDDDDGWIVMPDNPTNDSQKGADYYFCKNDFTKYKRVVTNIGIGYYNPPKLNGSK